MMDNDISIRSEKTIGAAFVIWIVNSVSLLIADAVLPGVLCDRFYIAFMTGAVLMLLTYLIEPVLYLLTLPINIATFGLFTLVLNGIVLYVVSKIVTGFHFRGSFWEQLMWAVLAAAIVGFFRMIVRRVLINMKWLRTRR